MYKENFNLKLDLDNITSLNTLFRLFIIYGKYELYLVGGCVRDFLLNRHPNDIDLCTNATPEQIKELLNTTSGYKTWNSGLKHGTLTITDSLCHTSYEITTFRVDGKYSDNRRPDEVTFTPSLEEDLKRRDFTVNSFAYNLLSNELLTLDETHMKDLELGIIKCVGDADTRFQEDALRMMRVIRFSAQLNYSIDANTFNAIKRNVDLIKNISVERIRDELTKILCSDNPQMLELLISTTLYKHVMPELEDMLNCKQINKYHYTDVLHHTFDVIKNISKSNARLRWSALFHDMGKPFCITVDLSGQEHFYGHALVSADKVKYYAEHLKFDTDSLNYVYTIVKYHDRDLMNIKKKTIKELVTLVGKDMFNDYLMFRHADALAHNLSADEDMLNCVAKAKDKYKEILLYKEPIVTKDLVIDGYDVMSVGVLSGIEVGKALKFCLELVLENSDNNNKDILLDKLKQKLYNDSKDGGQTNDQ